MCDKLCIAIKQIFDNAIDEGVLENNPFTRLSKRFKKPITKNFPSIPPKELMAFQTRDYADVGGLCGGMQNKGVTHLTLNEDPVFYRQAGS